MMQFIVLGGDLHRTHHRTTNRGFLRIDNQCQDVALVGTPWISVTARVIKPTSSSTSRLFS